MNKRNLISLVLVAAMLLAVVPAVYSQDTTRITFWSNEFQPARVERQQAIIDAFEAANPGVEVELVVMDENLMDQLMTLNVAAGTPPDVVLHPLQLSAKWYDQGLLDAEFATQMVNDLGADTFSAGALGLYEAPDTDGWFAIPSDGWGQMLIYRKDLFDEAGLEPPTSYENIMAAAEALHDPENGFVGFLGASSPSELFTWQVFEHVALANGANLTDAEGNVNFNSPEMQEAMEFYVELMNNYGPLESDYYWLQTRAEYFAGNGAMVIWSPFILDEMAGLRDSVLPTCAECEEDPAFIARNSSVVSAFVGPSGESPAAWGSVNAIGVAPGADPAAQAFVEYWMNDAYLDGLSIAAEGKFPMRPGTADEPTLYQDGWGNLEVGVDTRAPLSDFYDEETLATIVEGANGYVRMGFGSGQDLLASAVSAQFFIQENLVAALNGDLTVEEALEEIQIAIEDLQFELEEG
jgi:multiple sugar transport system substrate-binding protein